MNTNKNITEAFFLFQPGGQVNPIAKRMRMNENSILYSGNLQNLNQTVDSTASYKVYYDSSSTYLA